MACHRNNQWLKILTNALVYHFAQYTKPEAQDTNTVPYEGWVSTSPGYAKLWRKWT